MQDSGHPQELEDFCAPFFHVSESRNEMEDFMSDQVSRSADDDLAALQEFLLVLPWHCLLGYWCCWPLKANIEQWEAISTWTLSFTYSGTNLIHHS